MNDLELARARLEADACAFVIVRDGQVVATGTQDGIGELLAVVAAQGAALRGASLADKIAGKAVAMVAAYAGLVALYTPLGSQAAAQTCAAHHIAFEAARLVPLIKNKRGDGPCPMERLTAPLDDPAAAVRALGEFVAQRKPVPAPGLEL